MLMDRLSKNLLNLLSVMSVLRADRHVVTFDC